ncbi:head decoration protein [Undibacterium sp. Di26W]|uniref:head decoration protein n=1 Tax=Undibacterium sp. Di26W TaxID=3413035 RepID=UPI003BF408DF
MSNTFTEGTHTGEWLLSEANGTQSRDKATLLAQTAGLPSGQVLGKVTASGKYTKYDNTKSDGTETAAGVLYTQVGITSGDTQVAIISRNAEVAGGRLTGYDVAAKPELLVLGIVVR